MKRARKDRPQEDRDPDRDEIPEPSAEAMARARPVADAAPDLAAAVEATRRTRGPNKKPTKEQVTLRLDPDVIAAAKGHDPKGWQSRVNATLRTAFGLAE